MDNYIWYVRTLQGPHARQTVFTWPQPHFMDQWTRLSFGGQVHISDTISNRASIFGVWKDCKVYMSNWQVSSDLDLIFMIQWSKLSFWVLVYFSNTLCISQLYLVYGNILWFICLLRRFYLTLTSFSRSIAKF